METNWLIDLTVPNNPPNLVYRSADQRELQLVQGRNKVV